MRPPAQALLNSWALISGSRPIFNYICVIYAVINTVQNDDARYSAQLPYDQDLGVTFGADLKF